MLRLAWNVVRFQQISPAFIVEVKIPKFFLELVGVRNRRFLDSKNDNKLFTILEITKTNFLWKKSVLQKALNIYFAYYVYIGGPLVNH